MPYKSLYDCINDLEKNDQLIRIKEEIDPNLEMASIHLEEFKECGKAILFENVKGSRFCAVSNLFGTIDRSHFIFRNSLDKVKKIIEIKTDPIKAIKNPFYALKTAFYVLNAFPKKVIFPKSFQEILIEDLPQIKCWKDDGGAFITLPQVYSEDVENPGIMHSNLGMYRIQLSGNDYILNKEVG
ncbi:uncharacterized protein METZ01_LOCUS412184, partial [marine metagenome]